MTKDKKRTLLSIFFLVVFAGALVWLNKAGALESGDTLSIDSYGASYAGNWSTYNAAHYGGRGFSTPFSFQYPPDWKIEDNGEFEKWMIVKLIEPSNDPVAINFYVSELGYHDEFKFLKKESIEDRQIQLNGTKGTHFVQKFPNNDCVNNYYLISDNNSRFFEIKFDTCPKGILDDNLTDGQKEANELVTNIANTLKLFPEN